MRPHSRRKELEQLVAPIALYPDSLVAQILMASTYPLEVVEAARWSKANSSLKGKALEDALQQQDWDASVKSLTAFPQVLAQMNEKLDVTQKLGDAFLAQQKEVLDAVQRLRAKADAAGNLKSGKEQTVSKAQEGGTTIIKIEPTDPQTVYVPTYSPAVYGAWPYPAYPPYYYPYPPGAGLFAFGVGLAIGGALWGGVGWGGGNVNVNVNKYNNFNKTNISNGNWNHAAEHRKGAGYRDSASQQKFGGRQSQGAASREQFRGRAEAGQRDIARGGADGSRAVIAEALEIVVASGIAAALAIEVVLVIAVGWVIEVALAIAAVSAIAEVWAVAAIVEVSEEAAVVAAVAAARSMSAVAARRGTSAAVARAAAAG
jgi:hypothetical protein